MVPWICFRDMNLTSKRVFYLEFTGLQEQTYLQGRWPVGQHEDCVGNFAICQCVRFFYLRKQMLLLENEESEQWKWRVFEMQLQRRCSLPEPDENLRHKMVERMRWSSNCYQTLPLARDGSTLSSLWKRFWRHSSFFASTDRR